MKNHTLELRNKDENTQKIVAVMCTTYAKTKPEKINSGLYGTLRGIL